MSAFTPRVQEGPSGPAGATGPQGPNGLSAYEVAVAQGYTGTINEWILSLQGAPGTGADSLQELNDVLVPTPLAGHYLSYNAGGYWENLAPPAGGFAGEDYVDAGDAAVLGAAASDATSKANAAQAAAIAASTPAAHATDTANPHAVTKAQVGLGSADNTSDADKPVSTAQQTALDLKLNADDASVTNAREWTATEVSQAEAEAGTETTARKWTALRVRQAIAAWWLAITNIDGKIIGATTRAAGNFTTLDANGNVTLGDTSTDRHTINGTIGLGTTPQSYYGLNIGPSTLITGDASPAGIFASPMFQSDSTNLIRAIQALVRTQATSFTVTNAAGFFTSDASKGAGSTITSLHGLYVGDLTGGTNNYGITSLVSAGANKWNIYASGTAQNYFAGNVGIGGTPAKQLDLHANNTGITTGDPLNILRFTDTDTTSAAGQPMGRIEWYSSDTDTAGVKAYIQVQAVDGSPDADLVFATNHVSGGGTVEKFRLNYSGTAILKGGLISSDGVGLTFPATQVASSDANTLDDYREESYTATATGMTTSPTGTVEFVRVGRQVTMEIPTITGTSNATTFTLTGGPATMRPTSARRCVARVQDNGGAVVYGQVVIGTNGVISLYPDPSGNNFNASGLKGVHISTVSYII